MGNPSERKHRPETVPADIENRETRIMDKPERPNDRRDPNTELVGPLKRRTEPKPEPSDEGEKDPVVGWVVVIDGPGKGEARRLRYGRNCIGRDGDQEVQLDLGDDHISRKQHAAVVYDPRSRKFLLQHGEGRNLTYIGDQHVLSAVELKGGEHISLGRTVLRFVPLCGPDFDWQSSDQSGRKM